MTPVDDFVTRVYAVVTFRLPLPDWLVKPFLTPVALRIFAAGRGDAEGADRADPALRRREIHQSPSSTCSGHEVWRLLKQACDGCAAARPRRKSTA